MNQNFDQNFYREEKRHRRNSGFKWAMILIIVGLIALVCNMGIITTNYTQIIFSWAMLALVIGFFLFLKRFPYFTFWGWMWMCIGIFFLIPKFQSPWLDWHIPLDFKITYWPVLFIVAGLLLLLKWLFPKPSKGRHFFIKKNVFVKPIHKDRETKSSNHAFHPFQAISDIFLNVNFGNKKHVVLEKEFKGGSVNGNFSEVTLDLRKTELVQETTYLKVDVNCGNITICVPLTWQVEWQGNVTLGDFADKRDIQPTDLDMSKKLIINGSCNFGSIQLTR